MTWRDPEELRPVTGALTAVRAGDDRFAELVLIRDPSKLLDRLVTLQPQELYEIVLARVLAEQLASRQD